MIAASGTAGSPAMTGFRERHATDPRGVATPASWSWREAGFPRILRAVVEVDVDALEPLGLLGTGRLGVGPVVRVGQVDRVGEGSEQGARMQVVHPNDVDLHAEHEHDRS